MSAAPRMRSINVSDPEARPVLGAGGKNEQRSVSAPKLASKPLRKAEKMSMSQEVVTMAEDKNALSSSTIFASSPPTSEPVGVVSLVLYRKGSSLHSNLSLSASCSSDASTDSFRSRASTGRIYRPRTTANRRRQLSKSKVIGADGILEADGLHNKKRCAWLTLNTDPSYVSFHDEEWGIPVHDDKKLFELLVLSGALAELTWPSILSKRHMFREVFADFDPITVAKFNDKKILAPGSTANLLLSELKLRTVIENARQIAKVIDEFGSFDTYIWSFVNYKPIVSKFRYPRQVPVKTPKADLISKDLVRRGFRGVGPTVIYSFMQAAGLTNDHLVSCFRFHECISFLEGKNENAVRNKLEQGTDAIMESGLQRAVDDLSFASE